MPLSFIRSAEKFAELSPDEVKTFTPIVIEVAEGRISKNELIDLKKLDPRFYQERPGSTSAERMSPLGLALSYLFNNFNKIHGRNAVRKSAMKPDHARFAVEIDSYEIKRDASFQDELPVGARILRDEKWEKAARAEFQRGRTYRAPARPLYFVIEWTEKRGTIGRLLDFFEDRRFPVTRYAELFD